MPCLSSSADSALNESIRVSNAESQLALPLSDDHRFRRQRDFLAERIGGLHRRGSRRRRGGRRLPRGLAFGWRAGPDGCRRGAGVAAAGGRRRRRLRQRSGDAQRNRGYRDQRDQGKAEKAGGIHSVFSMAVQRSCRGARMSRFPRRSAANLTRRLVFRPVTDISSCQAALRRHGEPPTQIYHHTGQSAVIRHIRQA